MHILDNETSEVLKWVIQKNEAKYQLAEHSIHHVNPTERVIKTFQNNFIIGLTTLNPHFHLVIWDELLEHSEITLIGIYI